MTVPRGGGRFLMSEIPLYITPFYNYSDFATDPTLSQSLWALLSLGSHDVRSLRPAHACSDRVCISLSVLLRQSSGSLDRGAIHGGCVGSHEGGWAGEIAHRESERERER